MSEENRELESIERLEYQLQEWESVARMHLPPTNDDRCDIDAISRLIKSLEAENGELKDKFKQVCAEVISLDNELRDSQLSIPTPCGIGAKSC